ncbi:Sugar transport protein 14 [Colletotrichum orbiculare MAFF 240422]|uniref:Sugar transport protein 14 n=1 Tax=Colletotrichum orbiculare (strain 104-T / ATCC 96160 / CBS 514.97 / LARS 414 / MAFF 240422) TaxID=1213857 RepID=N4VEE8_COLOR|nr:Sugar transport protein 14 [Colletotrichum orbiculare MAFF 240422]
MSRGSDDEVDVIGKQSAVEATASMEKAVTGEMKNPLMDKSRDEVIEDSRAFAQLYHLPQEEFVKGALVAQNPREWQHIAQLSPDDRIALEKEQNHKWRHPKALYFNIACNAIAAVIQGWDQTGSNGANLSFPKEFRIPDDKTTCEELLIGEAECARNAWIVGAINSAPYMAVFLFACWISDPINHYIGRRGCIFVGSIFSLIAPIAQGFARSPLELIAYRVLLGIGMGLKDVTVPVFSSEIAPAIIRGALVMSWQLFVAIGILLGFIANLAVAGVGPIAWRLQLGSAMIPAIPLLIGIYFCPESPRWLIARQRYGEAYEALLKLRGASILASRDLYYMHVLLDKEKEIAERNNYSKGNFFHRARELFTVPRNRRATQASGIIMAAQQFCGINAMAFYSSTIFREAGLQGMAPLLASMGFGLATVLGAIPAIWTIDTWGRRPLLLATFPQMCWTLLAAGFCFLIDKEQIALRCGLLAAFIYLFAIAYGPGEGPCAFVYSAEVFPLSHREAGMAWAVATNMFWATIVSLTWPALLKSLGPTACFSLFAFTNFMSFWLIFFFLPETKQRTLEELDDVFAVPTRRHASYQIKEVLPWWFRRYVLRQKGKKCPSLYEWEKTD